MLRLRSDHNALLPSAGIRPNKPIVAGMTLKSEAPPSAADADPAPGGDSQHRRTSTLPLAPPCFVVPSRAADRGGGAVTSKRLYEVSVKIKFCGKTLLFVLQVGSRSLISLFLSSAVNQACFRLDSSVRD
jgi:hypothetical protein